MNKEREARAKARLAMYYEAEEAVLSGQSFSIGSRTLTRANLAEIVKMIRELERQVVKYSGKNRSMGRIIPMDF